MPTTVTFWRFVYFIFKNDFFLKTFAEKKAEKKAAAF